MFRKYILPLLAVGGIAVGILAAFRSAETIPPAVPVSEAPQPPFLAFVAGSAIVEANTENIAIGTQVPGVVSAIYVKVGSRVRAGAPFFTIDDRATRAELALREAAVQVAEAQLTNAVHQLALAESVTDKRAMSLEELLTKRDAVLIGQAQLAQARAQSRSTQTDLERLTVRAPVDGEVLQLKVRPGEFATAGVLAQPLILFGNVEPLHARVDVDENDAWRVRAGAAAVGYLRGNKAISTALKFVRFEPYVIPKVSLTGDSAERVDTRVLEVIYSLNRGDLPIFAGQQMDVYIDASEARARQTNAPPNGGRP